LKITANHSAVTSHNCNSRNQDSATHHSVIIIASRQAHCGYASLSEVSVSEEDILLGSEYESQTDFNHQDDVNRGSEQFPRSVMIIASTPSSPTNVRSDLHNITPSHASAGQQTSELVPNKLLSLSLSLLVAAFFQVIRCLTEFLEETFRTLHCELNME
jgi:hypothetical protein